MGLRGIGILDHVEQVAVEGLTWVDVQQPIPSEIGRLGEAFPVDPLDLQVALQPHSRQSVVGREGYAIVRLDVPAASRRTRALETVPLTIFVGASFVISIHSVDLRSLGRMFREAQLDEQVRRDLLRRSGEFLAHQVIERLIAGCEVLLGELADRLGRLEAATFLEAPTSLGSQGVREGLNEDVSEIVRAGWELRRDARALERAARSILSAVDALRARASTLPGQPLQVEWADLDGRCDRLIRALDEQQRTVSALAVTMASLVQQRTNRLLSGLLMLTGIGLPLLLLASIYGMQVRGLPLAEHPYGFEAVLLAMGLIVVAGLALFRRQGWL